MPKFLYSFYLFIAICFTACSQKVSERPPNIIIILTDDQGWGDLSHSGNPNLSTPNIDLIAQNGISFSNFYVSAVCSPTRAEILTGRYHVRSGISGTSSGNERLNLNETTIAEVFREAGYTTGAFGKWHNGTQPPYHPNTRGFQEFYGFCSGHWGNYFSPMLERNGEVVKGNGYLTDDLTQEAIRFVRRNEEHPFFLLLSLNTPHSPMQVPDQYWEKFANQTLKYTVADEDTLFTKAALAMVENIDDNVGLLMNEVNQLDIEDRTIVIYLSDNGPNSKRWNGGLKGIKGSVDEGGLKVPFFMQWKDKITEGNVIHEIAGGIDLLPTLVAMAGINANIDLPLDGIDISGLILNKDEPEYDNDRLLFSFWQNRVSVRNQEFRLDHKDSLYAVNNDPGQTIPVNDLHPETAAFLKAKKKVWIDSVAALLNIDDRRPFTIGHKEMRYTHLPARDAKATGSIIRSNQWPNDSYFTNWKNEEDFIFWEVEVMEPGLYDIDMYYTCDIKDEGFEMFLEFNETITGAIMPQCKDSKIIGESDDRYPRKESYVKDFYKTSMGSIELQKGSGILKLKAIDVKKKAAIDFRLLVLKKNL